LLVFLAVSIIWLSLMITLILCGLFLCALNLTPFHIVKFFSSLLPRSLAAPSKTSSVTMVVSSTMPPPMHFFASSGVIQRMSCLYTSSQNGKVERSLRTINNMLRSLLFQAFMSSHYWITALHTATYLLNRLPCKAISAPSPYVALYGVAPSSEHLRIFGCVCYPNLSA
jgi:hypothetical protein